RADSAQAGKYSRIVLARLETGTFVEMEALAETDDIFYSRLQSIHDEIGVAGALQRLLEIVVPWWSGIDDRFATGAECEVSWIAYRLVGIQSGPKARQADDGFEDRTRSITLLGGPVSLRTQRWVVATGDFARRETLNRVIGIYRRRGSQGEDIAGLHVHDDER